MSLLLAIDTSGRSGGIALARYEGEFAVVLAHEHITGGTFSAELIPQLDALLAQQQLSLNDVSAIGVITGPGSFTGLRIGLAAVKGLCEARPLPIVPVTMLELMASAAQAARVTTILDAGRSEAYVGVFTLQDGIAQADSEELVRITEIDVKGLGLTPDTTIARAVSAIEVPRPGAADLAVYAVRKLARGSKCAADALDATYIRRSDAELFSKPRSS